MPIYEFKCKKGHVFERYVPNTVSKTVECPVCKERAKRILSPCHFRGVSEAE